MMAFKKTCGVVLVGMTCLAGAACDTKTGTGIAVGGSTGAVVGGLIEGPAGAIAGAAVGSLLGGLVGNSMDQKARKYVEKQTPSALGAAVAAKGQPYNFSDGVETTGTVQMLGNKYISDGMTCASFKYSLHYRNVNNGSKATKVDTIEACQNNKGEWLPYKPSKK